MIFMITLYVHLVGCTDVKFTSWHIVKGYIADTHYVVQCYSYSFNDIFLALNTNAFLLIPPSLDSFLNKLFLNFI